MSPEKYSMLRSVKERVTVHRYQVRRTFGVFFKMLLNPLSQFFLTLSLVFSFVGVSAFASTSEPDLNCAVASSESALHLKEPFTVQLDLVNPAAQLDSRFLSFAMDSSFVFGGKWWDGKSAKVVPPFNFHSAKLTYLTSFLTPAYLRIGGTEADKVFYDLSAHPVMTPPEHHTVVMNQSEWDAINEFAQKLDLKISFNLNAGLGARTKQGNWNPNSARELITYTAAKHYPVEIWELGNEIGFMPFTGNGRVTSKQYAKDLVEARKLLTELQPQAKLLANPSAFESWLGDRFDLIGKVLKHSVSETIQIMSWHYYPEQSSRCKRWLQLRHQNACKLISPGVLDEAGKWAKLVNQLLGEESSPAEAWLGETSSANCGGAPGISDRYVDGIWWLDELGQMAHENQKVVIRQDLVGADYGILGNENLEPRPNYWNAVIWKHLMGQTVLNIKSTTPDRSLRIYAQCTPKTYAEYLPGAVTVLVLNASTAEKVSFGLDKLDELPQWLYRFGSPHALGQKLFLNGDELMLNSEGKLPVLSGVKVVPAPGGTPAKHELEPLAYEFIVIPDAHAPACKNL